MAYRTPRAEYHRYDAFANHYEVLATKYRILHLYGVVAGLAAVGSPVARDDNWSASGIADQIELMSLEDPVTPIVLFIDTPGGIIRDGQSLIDTMVTCEAPVYTVGKTCQSMGAIILAAGEPGHRYVTPQTETMIHLPSGSVSGDEAQIKIQSKQFTKIKKQLADFIKDRGVGKTTTQIYKDMDREFYLDAQETIDYGLADKMWSTADYQAIKERAKPF